MLSRPILKAISLLVACALLCGGLAAAPVGAKGMPNVGSRLMGVVVSVLGTTDNPNFFTLQLGTDTAVVRIAPRTVFTPKSAEASLAGFTSGDYAIVTFRRFKGTLVAGRILFDVQPLAPLRLFDGTVMRVAPNGQRFVIRLVGTIHLVNFRLSKTSTLYQLDGSPAISPVTLAKGNDVEILGLNTFGGWVAYTVNLKSATQRAGVQQN
jgi:hypothetical protein